MVGERNLMKGCNLRHVPYGAVRRAAGGGPAVQRAPRRGAASLVWLRDDEGGLAVPAPGRQRRHDRPGCVYIDNVGSILAALHAAVQFQGPGPNGPLTAPA